MCSEGAHHQCVRHGEIVVTDKRTSDLKALAAKAAQLAKWQDENREAFAAYDARTEARGVFSNGKRQF